MKKVNTLIEQRLKPNKTNHKMTVLASESSQGNLSSFTGIFRIEALSEQEKKTLQELLGSFAKPDQPNIQHDLDFLITLTAEVKAINHQAALLHGERIQKAQNILKTYQEGAFTAWLIATYGNRQTPYNFLQYFEFYTACPKPIQLQIESIPRQAIYTLATRQGKLSEKLLLIQSYQGETKDQFLAKIREQFPLNTKDRRRAKISEFILHLLDRVLESFNRYHVKLSRSQKDRIQKILTKIQAHL